MVRYITAIGKRLHCIPHDPFRLIRCDVFRCKGTKLFLRIAEKHAHGRISGYKTACYGIHQRHPLGGNFEHGAETRLRFGKGTLGSF